MLKEGAKHMTGLEEATYKNIEAAKQLSSCVRTSLGPNGMNKMVINHLEKLFITNDSATIVQELEVQHPAAKLLVMASKMQEGEVGDGTNLVVVLAGELLDLAEELLKNGLHISEVISGYTAASHKALEHLDSLVSHSAPVDVFSDPEKLASCIKSVIAAKQWGNEDLFAGKIAEVRPHSAAPEAARRLAAHSEHRPHSRLSLSTTVTLAQACKIAMPKNVRNFNVDNVRVAKIIGNAVDATTVVRGLCLPRNVVGTIKEVKNAKIAVYGVPLDAVRAAPRQPCSTHVHVNRLWSPDLASAPLAVLSHALTRYLPSADHHGDQGHGAAEERG